MHSPDTDRLGFDSPIQTRRLELWQVSGRSQTRTDQRQRASGFALSLMFIQAQFLTRNNVESRPRNGYGAPEQAGRPCAEINAASSSRPRCSCNEASRTRWKDARADVRVGQGIARFVALSQHCLFALPFVPLPSYRGPAEVWLKSEI